MEMMPTLATALALRGDAPSSQRSRDSVLSQREEEVLLLLATGRSNREIAETLLLSVRTVERHISNIYIKLDVHTRTQATAYAHTHGLVGSGAGHD
jgi:DNA-binding NarL/FixJ family response regulator